MKKIVINEYQLNKMLLDMERNYTSGKYFINEMPYTPKDFLGIEKTLILIDNYQKKIRRDIGNLPDNSYKKGLEDLIIGL